MIENMFAKVPLEMLADKRLTLWHIKVLVALLSFRNKDSDTVWPGRDRISERCGGMHLSNISKTTSELCDLGWLVKQGDGGNSRSARYKIVVPDLQALAESYPQNYPNVAESATNPNVAESATHPPQTVAESATPIVAESARGIEQTTEQTTKSNRQRAQGDSSRNSDPPKLNAQEVLLSLGISAEVVDDWIELRKKLKAPITRTVLKEFQSEAEKAGCTLEQALRTCCKNGWRGFEASWVKDRGGGGARPKVQTPGLRPWFLDSNQIVVEAIKRKLPLRGHTESLEAFENRVRQAAGVTPEVVRKAREEFYSAAAP